MPAPFKHIIIIFLLLIAQGVEAQVLYSNGPVWHVASDAQVVVRGAAEFNGSSINNEGVIDVDSAFTISNASISGLGSYYFGGNISRTNAPFTGAAEVQLDGANQIFTGTTALTTRRFVISGSGVKQVQFNVEVDSLLDLSSLVLDMGVDTVSVSSSEELAVLNNAGGTRGYVAASQGGILSRNTSLESAYLFPVGGVNIGYRPMFATPTSTNTQTIHSGMYELDASAVGFATPDEYMCNMNDAYYHVLNGPDNGFASLQLYYEPLDGDWQKISRWGHDAMWSTSDSAQYIAGNSSLLFEGYTPMDGGVLVLANRRPKTPELMADTICGDELVNVAADHNDAYTYYWEFTNADKSNDPVTAGNSEVTMLVTDTIAPVVQLYVVDEVNNCPSLDTIVSTLTLGAVPTASISAADSVIYVHEILSLTSTSENATSWLWDMDNGHQAYEEESQVFYETPGVYEVELIAMSDAGCDDTTTMSIEVTEDVLIPNVITPNADGYNDVLQIKASGMDTYTITIMNRWGAVVYEGNESSLFWGGQNLAGEACVDGTYFFSFIGDVDGTQHKQSGYITLYK